MSATTLYLVIYGRVQGVSYRDSMRRQAQNLGVNGWVRNRPDGAVEAVVQGAPGDVELIINWSKRGPQMAEVVRVDVEPADGSYSSFEILF